MPLRRKAPTLGFGARMRRTITWPLLRLNWGKQNVAQQEKGWISESRHDLRLDGGRRAFPNFIFGDLEEVGRRYDSRSIPRQRGLNLPSAG